MAKNGKVDDGQLVENAMLVRQLLRDLQTVDRRRNLEHECGYPDRPTSELFQQLYDSDPIAARIVRIHSQECWREDPEIYESEEEGAAPTPFEAALADLSRNLLGGSSYAGSEEGGSPLLSAMETADVLSGIGRYGVLLLGLGDGLPLDQPAQPRPGNRLLFLRCFQEQLAPVQRWEADPSNQRYGQPTSYQVTFGSGDSADSSQTTTREVHWTRVVHVPSDDSESSDLFGKERLRAQLHRVLDLRKLYGGSAEMYWRGAFPGISIESHPNLGGEVTIDRTTTRDELERYMNGLQRYIALTGMGAKSLSPQVVDPQAQIDVQLTAICVGLDCPKRIFMGTERGELASDQDAKRWNRAVKRRRLRRCTPRIIVPVVDRLVQLGVLPAPRDGWRAWWPSPEESSDQERAEVGLTKVRTLGRYVSSGASQVVAPIDLLTKFLGFPKDEAETMLEGMTGMIRAEETPPEGESDDLPEPTDADE